MFVLIWVTVCFSLRGSAAEKGLTPKPTVVIPPLTEGHQSTLTCTAPGLCSGSHPKITWTWRKGGKDSQITGNTTASKTENLTAVTHRHSLTLNFNLSAEHHGTNVTCKVSFAGDTTRKKTVTLNVKYKRKLQIIGNTTVKKGSDLNLTCSVKSFPPSVIKWTKHSAHGIHLHNNTGSATLVISNVAAEDSGQYVCTATYQNKNVTAQVEVTVTWFSKILKGSGCVLQSKVLTCVCISEGFPLPTIKWPLLKDHTEYSVIKTVSNNTVNSTVSLTGGNHGNISVECFSSSENAEATETFMIKQDMSRKDADGPKTCSVSWLQVILAFLIGVLLSALFSCCLILKYCRKKQKNSGYLDDNIEMISQDSRLIYDDQAVQDGQLKVQKGAANRAAAAEKAAPESNNGPKDLVYASIRYSLLNKRPRGAAKIRQNTETVYAEVKTKKENDAGDMMTEEDNETKDSAQKVEEGSEELMYSTVKDLTDES